MKQIVLLLLAIAAAPLAAAHGATITVAPGAVAVNPGNGSCSLREAIANAESDSDTSGNDCTVGSGSDTIELAANSTYSLPDSAVTDPNYGNSGLPAINTTIVIDGNGATIERSPSLFSGTACSGSGPGPDFRIVYVGPTGNLTLNDLTLRYGCASFTGTGAGGAIFNRGTVSTEYTTIAFNQALSSGGAIQNDGTMTLTHSSVSTSDTLSGAGGAIVNTATLSVVQSTIDTSTTPGAGGGIDNTSASATIELANSTLSGNSSAGAGGGLINIGSASSATLTNATIAENDGTTIAAAPTAEGSGVYKESGTMTLQNTLLALQVGGLNCFNVSSTTSSLADDTSCNGATFTATPKIGPLANNGGPTLTHALLTGSPAIDTGDNAICGSPPVNGVDQRGVLRPQGPGCDVGAFEVLLPVTAIPAVSFPGLALLALLLASAGLALRR